MHGGPSQVDLTGGPPWVYHDKYCFAVIQSSSDRHNGSSNIYKSERLSWV